MNKVKLSPSLMCADFLRLGQNLDLFSRHGIDYLHIDIMDGHYVPNFTLGIDFCRTVASHCRLPLDIHLMIENVDAHVPAFASLRDTLISFHPEGSYHPMRTIQLIKSHGARAGIALDPSVPIESVRHLLPCVDSVCVMTVSPGYAGQSLVEGAIDFIREASQYARQINENIEIEVDGNVSWKNIPTMLEAGADVLVLGSSSVFSKKDTLENNLVRLKGLVDYFVHEQKAISYARE